MCASWAEASSVASMTSRAMSHRCTALTALRTLKYSMPFSILPGRRMPAVSIRTEGWFSYVNLVSSASLVVPGTSLTMALSWPSMAFISMDLPTLVLPTMASFMASSTSLRLFGGGQHSPPLCP